MNDLNSDDKFKLLNDILEKISIFEENLNKCKNDSKFQFIDAMINNIDDFWDILRDFVSLLKKERINLGIEDGNPEALHQRGYDYYEPTEGFTRDYEEAVKWFKLAAEKGYDQSQSFLGHCYLSGKGVSKNYEEAVKWFKLAAEQGDDYSLNGLGDCYFKGGYGVPQDYEEAIKWYKLSADSNDENSCESIEQLILCYENGLGVPQDYKEALKWSKKMYD